MAAAPQRRVLAITMYDRTLLTKPLPIDNADVWIGRWTSIPYLRLCWHTLARLDVLAHCFETPNVEVGGVLIGAVYRTPESGGPEDFPVDFIEIVGAIRARDVQAGVGHIEFSPESWAEINRKRDRSYASEEILGWYHSHPGHGLFLSQHDLFIHNNYFAEEFQLALVVDTHKRSGAFWIDSTHQRGPYESQHFHWNHRLVTFLRPLLAASPAIASNAGSSTTTASVTERPPAPDQLAAISISEEELSPEQPAHQNYPTTPVSNSKGEETTGRQPFARPWKPSPERTYPARPGSGGNVIDERQ